MVRTLLGNDLENFQYYLNRKSVFKTITIDKLRNNKYTLTIDSLLAACSKKYLRSC
jgi:hypothetical protein